jgi:acyl-CoA dehydrogenase
MDFLSQVMQDPSGLLLSMVTEEIASFDLGIALSLFGTLLPVAAIAASGTPEQIGTWIPRCFGTVDKPEVAAFVASEPEAGSDVSAVRTRARLEENEWVLTGTKTWGTNAGIADVHVITAVVDPELGSRGQAAFLIRRGAEGFSQGQKFSKLGIRASHTAEVVLNDVRVPAEDVLGGPERLRERLERAHAGSSVRDQPSMRTFEATRPLVAALAVGLARAAYEYAVKYCSERVQFGAPLIENQGVSFTLAEMRTRIDASRLLTHRAARMTASGKPLLAAEGSQAKLFASETATWAAQQAVQLLGGAGFVTDHPVEKYLRDSQILSIFEGTSNINRLVIARAITGVHIS